MIIYQNYNVVEEIEYEGEKAILKRFNNVFCWKNELMVRDLLEKKGFPVPKLFGSSYLENIYSFFDFPVSSKILRQDENTVFVLLDFLHTLQEIKEKNLFVFGEPNEKLLEISRSNFMNGRIAPSLVKKIEKICSSYKPKYQCFCHGDFRCSNIFYFNGSVRGIIDFEFSGIHDPNKDYAYFWVDATRINKQANRLIKKALSKSSLFDENSFLFWIVYMHSMIIHNPRTNRPNDWALNLEKILEDF